MRRHNERNREVLENKARILPVLDQIETTIKRDPQPPEADRIRLVCAVMRGMIESGETDPQRYILRLLLRAFGREFAAMQFAAATAGLPEAIKPVRDAVRSIYRQLVVHVRDLEKRDLEKQPTTNTTGPDHEYTQTKLAEAKAIMAGLNVPARLTEAEAKPAAKPWTDATKYGPPWTIETLNLFLLSIKIPAPPGAAQDFASLSVCNLPRDIDGKRSGFVVQLHWATRCVTTGAREVVHGAKHYLSRHAAANEVAQAVLAAAIRASEHEIRERFTVDGQPIYRPHQPLRALLEMTAGTEPELRAIREAEVC